MTEVTKIVPSNRRTFEWYEKRIPVRGRKMTLSSISDLYTELSKINIEVGKKEISALEKDPKLSDEEWTEHKEKLLDDAFRLTITITSDGAPRIYTENIDIFTSKKLPKKINQIFFTNVTAYRRNSNQADPANTIDVNFDFSKPILLDPDHIVSSATPNESNVSIRGNDITFVHASQHVAESYLSTRGTWYRMIHKNFAYDLGLWFVALPFALLFTTYNMDKLLPVSSEFSSYRWAFFIYSFGIMLFAYRVLNSYAQWAFPVNILVENKDTAWRHRTALGLVVGWLGYKAADILFGLLF